MSDVCYDCAAQCFGDEYGSSGRDGVGRSPTLAMPPPPLRRTSSRSLEDDDEAARMSSILESSNASSSFFSSSTFGLELSALGEELQEEEAEAPWCGDSEKVVFQLRNLNMVQS